MKIRMFLSIFLSLFISLHAEVQEVYLKAPDLSDENIIGYNVGIRPYRKSGIRIEAEKLFNKTIIHNYGYGGSGLTLCFGGAQEVLTILNQEKTSDTKTVAVLGAGVIGLATAYDLMANGYKVNIYADQFSPNLTSNVAAGIWSPPAIPKDASEQYKQQLTRLIDVSTRRIMACTITETPEFKGVKIDTAFNFKLKSNSEKKMDKIFSNNTLSEKEEVIVHFDNGVTKVGTRKKMLGLDGKLFMEDLYAKVIAKGAKVYQKHFTSKSDLEELEEHVIVNCTSFGSQILFNDPDFIPIRGHLIHFKPSIDYIFYQELSVPNYWSTFYPWSDRLIVGGEYEEGVGECVIDKSVIDALLKYARESIGLTNI